VSAASRSRSSTWRTAPATSNLASLILDCYELLCEEGNYEDWGLIYGELGLGATVPAVLQYPAGTVHAQGCGGG
jgi:hypothetical protein